MNLKHFFKEAGLTLLAVAIFIGLVLGCSVLAKILGGVVPVLLICLISIVAINYKSKRKP